MEQIKERTLQAPIDSQFDGASTASDVIRGVDLSGKTAIVTGGYAGIGTETSKVLAKAGAKVIVPARDVKKAADALAGIEGVTIEQMDLMDPASIDAFTVKFLTGGQPLHILINSAGIMANPLTRDARGFESQFATNHLGHFQLTLGLWPALKKAQGARIVALSSWGHRYSPVVFEDINFEHRPYDPWKAYGQSKTANVLFAVEADRRGQADGIRAFAVHPGSIVSTDLKRYIPEEQLIQMGALDKAGNPVIDPARQLKTVEQGAATSVWCATSPLLFGKGGVYCENSDVSPVVESDGTQGSNDLTQRKASKAFGVLPHAIAAEDAVRLWQVSERMIQSAF